MIYYLLPSTEVAFRTLINAVKNPLHYADIQKVTNSFSISAPSFQNELVWLQTITSLIARFMEPTWGPSGADRTQVGPMLAQWTLLSGFSILRPCKFLYGVVWHVIQFEFLCKAFDHLILNQWDNGSALLFIEPVTEYTKHTLTWMNKTTNISKGGSLVHFKNRNDRLKLYSRIRDMLWCI